MEAKKSVQKIDRVVLDPKSISAIQLFSDQIKSHLGGLIQFSQKEIVNFILQERCSVLSEIEIEKIRCTNFDLVRSLKRATQEAIKVKKQSGKDMEFNAVLEIIQTPGVNAKTAIKEPRGRKKKNKADGDLDSENQLNLEQDNALKAVNYDLKKDQELESKSESMQRFSTTKSS